MTVLTNRGEKTQIPGENSGKTLKHCVKVLRESWTIKAISVVLLTTIFALGYVQKQTHDDIYELISKRGLKYATKYIRDNKTRYRHTYADAWVNFNNGHIKDSKESIDYLMNETRDPKIIGNCHYLRGYISLRELNHTTATNDFLKSIQEYTKISAYENLFYAYLGLSVSYMDSGDIIQSEGSLHHAITNFKIISNDLNKKYHRGLAEYYMVRKRLELLKGNLPNALINAENSLIFYRSIESKTGESNALSDIGFIHMLIGNYDLGWEYTLKAQSIIIKLEDDKKFVYNQLNILIYLRCHGMNYQYLIEEIENRIVTFHDNKLQKYLNRVLELSCDGSK